jgi:hypothetical protein
MDRTINRALLRAGKAARHDDFHNSGISNGHEAFVTSTLARPRRTLGDVDMPVFATLKHILAVCWHDRALAFRFGVIPLAINLALVVTFAEAADPTFASYATDVAIGLVSILAFAPFCVAWYRLVLFGKPEIEIRPVFTLKEREFRFFGWTILISILAGLVSVIALFVGGGIVIAVSALNAIAGVIAGGVMVIGWVAALLMILSRWSIALAMTAAGDHASLEEAWRISKSYGWSMAGIQLLIFLGVGVLAGVSLAGFFPDFFEAARAKTDPPPSAALALNLVATVFGAVSLWLSSTLFALAYRLITADKAATLTVPTDVQPSASE